MSASLAIYRRLIPAHGKVPDATVELWLELAAQQHTAAVWGAVYQTAMIWWSAAHIDPLVQSGQYPPGVACSVPAVAPTTAPAPGPYWSWYLGLRDTRAAVAPGHVGPC